MICNNCGTNVPDGSANCHYCGAPMPVAPVAEPAPQAMVCPNCGAPLAEGSAFCTSCGYSLAAAPAPEAPKAPKAPKGDKLAFLDKLPFPRKYTLIGAAGLVTLIVVLIIVLVSCGGNSPEAVAEAYVEAMFDADAEAMLDLLPEEIFEDVDDDELDEIIENGDKALKSALKMYEIGYGDDWDYSIEIKNVDACSKSDRKSLQKKYDKNYGLDVEEASEVEVEIEIDGEKRRDTIEETVTVVCIDGDWYLDVDEMDLDLDTSSDYGDLGDYSDYIDDAYDYLDDYYN